MITGAEDIKEMKSCSAVVEKYFNRWMSVDRMPVSNVLGRSLPLQNVF